MLILNWLNHVWSRNRRRGDRQPPKERRLRLMRLEQRRVLNADFQFLAGDSLTLSNVDADLTVRETGTGSTHVIEFHLSQDSGATVWQSTDPDNPNISGEGTPTLSINFAAFDAPGITASITATPTATHDVTLDASLRDLHLTSDALTIQGFSNLTLLSGNNEPDADLVTGKLTVTVSDEVVFIGSLEATGNIEISASGGLGNVRFSENLTITDGNLIVSASGETGLDGTTSIHGNIDIDTATLDLNGDIETFSDTSSPGTVTVSNSGVAEIGVGLTITSAGSVTFDGTGVDSVINLNSDIRTKDPGSAITVETSEIRVFNIDSFGEFQDRILTANGDITLAEVHTTTPGMHSLTLNADPMNLSSAFGNVTLNGKVDIDVVKILAGGQIIDGHGGLEPDIVANRALLSAAEGIGVSGPDTTLEVDVDLLDLDNSVSGGVFVSQDGDMTLHDLNGVEATLSGNGGQITANGQLLIDMDMTIKGTHTFSADGDLIINTDKTLTFASAIRLTANNITVAGDILAFVADPTTTDETIEINARGDFNLLSGHVITTDNAPDTLRTTGDSIRITADSDHDSIGGQVFLGTGAMISTDAGILQQIAPRPAVGVAETAFFDFTTIVTSTLISNGMDAGGLTYLGFLTVKIGVPGEKNLILDVDWGDTSLAMFTALQAAKASDIEFNSNTNKEPQAGIGGQLAFDSAVDQFKTRFFIPEGGVTYVIPHEYSSAAVNMPVALGEPGRLVSFDPFQVRFSVLQHPSMLILGRAVFDPSPSDMPTGTAQTVPSPSDQLANLTSTDSLVNPIAQEPRLDTGATQFDIPEMFQIPTPSTPPVIRIEPPIPPPELPKPAIPDAVVTVPLILTTEVSSSAAVSSAVSTNEYFELRTLNEDGTINIERLNDSQGEELLQKRESLEKFVSEKGDGEYEIWFVTKENRGGAIIERPVIRFRLEGGSLAPPTDDLPKLFKPFRLIPQGDAPEKAPEGGNAEAAGNSESSAAVQEPMMPEGSLQSGAAETREQSAIEGDSWGGDIDGRHSDLDNHGDSSLPAVAGVVVFAGAGHWKRRRGESKATLFSKAARMSRKWVGH